MVQHATALELNSTRRELVHPLVCEEHLSEGIALIKYNKRTLAPKSEKKKVVQVANEAYQAVIQAAEEIISMLANPQVAGVLSDLMPLRHQHSTQNWGHVFWPQRLDDYQKPLGADSSDEDEEQDEVRSDDEWSIPSTNPWKSPTPDPKEEAIKWGLTPVEESTPSLVSSRSSSPCSEVESFDLLPELDHLELSTVDELPEEEFHKALEVAARAPSPPPPPPTLIKNVEEPRG
ncbi:hypothetical protein GY45DRAFT_1373483 [Cubamyces sp. BRFM 1775]|nr:hypothetical protein GY45DRAFT_1373483 [Cubamyces sp. BRFM 1775]